MLAVNGQGSTLPAQNTFDIEPHRKRVITSLIHQSGLQIDREAIEIRLRSIPDEVLEKIAGMGRFLEEQPSINSYIEADIKLEDLGRVIKVFKSESVSEMPESFQEEEQEYELPVARSFQERILAAKAAGSSVIPEEEYDSDLLNDEYLPEEACETVDPRDEYVSQEEVENDLSNDEHLANEACETNESKVEYVGPQEESPPPNLTRSERKRWNRERRENETSSWEVEEPTPKASPEEDVMVLFNPFGVLDSDD